MTQSVCVTVDVEDFYDGMAVLGQQVERPDHSRSGLGRFRDELEACVAGPSVTLFVVGDYARKVKPDLEELSQLGHEVASHGPDHGRLPDKDFVGWLRKGRVMLEDMLQRPVTGFRSPRFDVPGDGHLAQYRDQLAEAGFVYVSDTHRLGPASPVTELQVLTWRGIRVGGGSYQRMMPRALVHRSIERSPAPVILYYHSYDFDDSLPGLSAVRSLSLARQLVGRGRVGTVSRSVLDRFGSETCGRAASGSKGHPA